MNENVISSKKINLSKKIKLAWIFVAAILVLVTVFSFIKYSGYKKAQEAAVEEDGRIGLIEKYLKNKPAGYEVCTYELWYDALGNDPDLKKPNVNLDLKPLKQLMGLFDEWERTGDRIYTEKYGRQRVWIKRKKMTLLDDDDEKLPFED